MKNEKDEAVRYAKIDKNSKSYQVDYNAQWAAAEKDVKAGKVICLTDLMSNSKNI